MKTWIKDSLPTCSKPHPYQVDVDSSEEVAVLVENKLQGNYIAIATYNDYKDDDFNKSQGRWRIQGHNGNWDDRILGWYSLPNIE